MLHFFPRTHATKPISRFQVLLSVLESNNHYYWLIYSVL